MATSPLSLEFDKFQHRWGWYLALGIALVILGVIAFFLAPAGTLASVPVLGWLLVISGIMEGIYEFRMRRWGGVFLHLVGGILGVLVGLLTLCRDL